MDELCEALRRRVLERLDFSRELEESELKELIARELSATEAVLNLTISERILAEQRVFNALRKLDILQDLLDDDAITEILVNGPNHVFYEKMVSF